MNDRLIAGRRWCALAVVVQLTALSSLASGQHQATRPTGFQQATPPPAAYPNSAPPALDATPREDETSGGGLPQEPAGTTLIRGEDGCGGAYQEGHCYSGFCDHCPNRWRLLPHRDWLRIGGWIDQGVAFNFHSPRDRSNTRVFFNDRSNDYLLNQAYLFAEVPVCRDGCQWGFGGRVDVTYGRDSRFITVPGLERHRDRTPRWNSDDGLYGVAVPQAFLEVAAPGASGVSLKAGHFYASMGYERFAAPDNFFYSHSYAYIFGQPFTFTGALATFKPADALTFQVGYTRGWDVWDSSSNEWGVLVGVKLATPGGRTSLALQVHSGRDITAFRRNNAFEDQSRIAYTLVFQHFLTERLRYVLQHGFGHQQDGQIVANIPTSTISFDAARWYGISQYLIFDHHEQLSSGLRVEWFRDQDLSRTSVPVVFTPGGPLFDGGHYVAVTGGVNWRPYANLTIRPELRWDWSDLRGNPDVPGGNPAVRTFGDGRRSHQFTAALDVILAY